MGAAAKSCYSMDPCSFLGRLYSGQKGRCLLDWQRRRVGKSIPHGHMIVFVTFLTCPVCSQTCGNNYKYPAPVYKSCWGLMEGWTMRKTCAHTLLLVKGWVLHSHQCHHVMSRIFYHLPHPSSQVWRRRASHAVASSCHAVSLTCRASSFARHALATKSHTSPVTT